MAFDLPALPSSATKARAIAREVVANYPAELSDTLAILVTELVTNAVLHARTDLSLRIDITPPLVCLSVADQSPRLPVVRDYATDEVTGRGLAMVDALAAEWGVEPTREGKSVWCKVLIPDADSKERYP